jgi:histidyl-tRNA synthetase
MTDTNVNTVTTTAGEEVKIDSTTIDSVTPTPTVPATKIKTGGTSAHAAGKKKEKKDNEKDTEQRKRPGMIVLEPVKGTRDFAPDDMRVRNWLFGKWKEIARLYAFQEYDAPILEHEELYVRKAGEEITQQMYNFKDKAERAVALRPEMTPSLARIILKSGSSLVMPLKWFSIPQCWRFEQTVRGRRREHFQWNMDIIGIPNVAAEVELLSAIVAFFKSVGLTSKDIGIRINSRKVIQGVLESLGITGNQFYETCIIVDKLDKMERAQIVEELKGIKISEDAINKILDALSVKSLEELAARVGDDSDAIKELRELFTLAAGYDFVDWLQFDASVVRGLAYYTGVVFEGFDRTGSIGRAICGGGRYDRLFEMFGASKKEQQPCAGFGFGDCVILEILKDRNLVPAALSRPDVDDVIAVQNDTLLPAAMTVANILRSKGRSTDVILNKKKNLGWAYSYADRLGAKRVVLVAPTEWENKTVKIKELRQATGEAKEQIVAVSEL